MKLLEAKPGDTLKVPLSGSGSFGFTFTSLGGPEVVLLKHGCSFGSYVGWKDGMPDKMPSSFGKPISEEERKKYGIDPKYKHGFIIASNVDIEMIKATKTKTAPPPAGFLLACLGAGVALSGLARVSVKEEQKQERYETLRS